MVALWMQSICGSNGSLAEKVQLNPASETEVAESIVGPKRKSAVKSDRCCLCGRRMSAGGIVVEERPTAEDGSVEKWFYCPACWVELRKLRDPSRSRNVFIEPEESSQDSGD